MDARRIAIIALIVAVATACVMGVLWAEFRAARRAAVAERDRCARRHDSLRKSVDALATTTRELRGALDRVEAAVRRTASRMDALEAKVARVARAAKPDKQGRAVGQPPQPQARDEHVTELLHDDFEKGFQGWVVPPLVPGITGVLKPAKGNDAARNGQGALALHYAYQRDKVAVAIRILGRVKGVTRVSVWVRCTEGVANLFLGASEADFSHYATMHTVAAADGWRRFDTDLADMELVPGSQDENNTLDLDQIMSLSVGDSGGFQGREGGNTLLIDDFRAYRVAPKPQDDF